MTYKEAVEKLKEDCAQMIAECECNNGKCSCHIHKAIEALEKQIPKKPDLSPHSDYDDHERRYLCSCCQNAISGLTIYDKDNLYHQYCFHCGQAIDWSE